MPHCWKNLVWRLTVAKLRTSHHDKRCVAGNCRNGAGRAHHGHKPLAAEIVAAVPVRTFRFRLYVVALVILPWTITLVCCPEPFAALAEVDRGVLLTANLFAFSWGIAQVLAMLCFARIGVSLTYGILCSVGAARASRADDRQGLRHFQGVPDLFSKPGLIVLAGMLILVLGVVFASLAGAGRESCKANRQNRLGNRSPPVGLPWD